MDAILLTASGTQFNGTMSPVCICVNICSRQVMKTFRLVNIQSALLNINR